MNLTMLAMDSGGSSWLGVGIQILTLAGLALAWWRNGKKNAVSEGRRFEKLENMENAIRALKPPAAIDAEFTSLRETAEALRDAIAELANVDSRHGEQLAEHRAQFREINRRLEGLERIVHATRSARPGRVGG